jgi:hypothetical protein
MSNILGYRNPFGRFGLSRNDILAAHSSRARCDASDLLNISLVLDFYKDLTARFGTPKGTWASVFAARRHYAGGELANILNNDIGHVSGPLVERSRPLENTLRPKEGLAHALFGSVLGALKPNGPTS